MKIVEIVQFLSLIEDVKYDTNINKCIRDMEFIVDDCIKNEDGGQI